MIPQKTAVTPLDRPPDVIFGAFGSTCRNMIRRAESEAPDIIVHEAADLKENPALLASFKREYDDFVRARGIQNTYNPTALGKYVEKGGALLTQVSKDGQFYARHIFVCDGLSARLLYSVSRFRDDTLDRKLASNANAYLHWKEIELLRDRGYGAMTGRHHGRSGAERRRFLQAQIQRRNAPLLQRDRGEERPRPGGRVPAQAVG